MLQKRDLTIESLDFEINACYLQFDDLVDTHGDLVSNLIDRIEYKQINNATYRCRLDDAVTLISEGKYISNNY